MKQTIVGLLPVDPHRLHVYWDAPYRKNVLLSIEAAEPEVVATSGSRYIGNLEANRSYQAALYAGDQLLAKSNVVTLPPDSPAPEAQPLIEIVPASR